MLKKSLKNVVQTSVIIIICMFKLIHYCLRMFLKKLETNTLKYMDLIHPSCFLSACGLAWQTCLKKTEVKLELLTDHHMLLMIEESIRGRMCQSTYRYAKANNKYMKNYDKKLQSSYITYLDANNIYGWATSQKLLVNEFRWVHDVSGFNEYFIKNYNENSDVGSFLQLDVEYPKKYLVLIMNYHFYQKENN